MIAAAELARLLGGEVVRVRGEEQVLAPGLGHSPGDRSLSIRFGPRGLQVHSFAADALGPERARLRKLCGKGTRTTKWTAPRVRPLATPKPDSAAIRSNIHCRFRSETVHCMVALVRHIATDRPQAIHRTALGWDDRNYS